MGIRLETFGDAECGIAGEGAEFEHSFGADHGGKHLEEPSLEVA